MNEENIQINSSENKKVRKGCLIPFFIVVGLFLFGIILATTNSSSKPSLTDNAKLIKEICNTNDEQAIAIDNVLVGCEIAKIKKIEHDELLDDTYNDGDTGYRIQTQEVNNIILYLNLDKEVIAVRYASADLYSNGTHKEKISAFLLSSNQKATLQTDCEQRVKAILLSPSTADFPWFDWEFSKDYYTGIVTISSYVDSQNAFGAEIRSYFTFMYELSENKYRLIYFEFDNGVIIDKR